MGVSSQLRRQVSVHRVIRAVLVIIHEVVIQDEVDFPASLRDPVQAGVDPEFVGIVVPLDEIDPGQFRGKNDIRTQPGKSGHK